MSNIQKLYLPTTPHTNPLNTLEIFLALRTGKSHDLEEKNDPSLNGYGFELFPARAASFAIYTHV